MRYATRTPLALLAIVLLLATGITAQKSQSAPALMRAAADKALVDGDLNAAIRQYQAVVDMFSTDRAVVAQALVRMAECHEKLGDAEAQKIYARVARDFADQRKEADTARARLAPQSTTAADVQTLWRGGDVNTEGTVSPDGRYLSYSDRETGDLAIRDLRTGSSRRLTAAPGDFTDWAEFSAISRDGKQVAYAWFADKKGHYELRVLPIDATANTQPRIMPENGELKDVYPFDWSPDGRWIAVRVSRGDRTAQIGLVATGDMSLTVLKSVDWRGPTKLFFSPDGKYLAYDLPVGESSFQRDVFVLNVDGSRETVAVAHPAYDVIMGWTNDGRGLLFASNRSGAIGLWMVPMVDGKASGRAVLLQPNLGPVNASLGMTSSGALALGLQTAGPNIFVGTIDLSTGALTAPAKPLVDGYLQANRQPEWSRDGKSIVYLSNRASGPSNVLNGSSFLAIQSLDSGRTTEVRPLMSWFLNPRFAPDGAIAVSGSDFKGRRGIYRVDAESGAVSPIVISDPDTCASGQSWSMDGSVMAYKVGCNLHMKIVVRQKASGEDREIVSGGDYDGPALSPDGRLLAFIEHDSAAKTSALQVIPLNGGATKQLLRVTGPMNVEWLPDGRRLLISKSDGGKRSVLIVALQDGSTIPLDRRVPPGLNALAISPDGKRIAFSEGETAYEVRTLDVSKAGSGREP